jgi:hypothetical protein
MQIQMKMSFNINRREAGRMKFETAVMAFEWVDYVSRI